VFRAQRQAVIRVLSTIVTCGLFVTQSVNAQLDDPTLPPNIPSIVAGKVEQEAGWKLSSVLVSSQRNIAIINGQSVQVGDELAGARIQSINENIVKLKYRGEILRLELYPVTVKTVREK